MIKYWRLFLGVCLFVLMFPAGSKEVNATTTTVYATSNSTDGSLAGWTDPTYAYTDDGTNFASRVGTAKNTWYGTLYGFDLSGIPDGSTINSVTLTAEWKNSAIDSSGPVLYLGAKSGGSEVGTGTSDTTGTTSFELVNRSPSGLTTANLKATGASGFWAILRFERTDNTAHTAYVDYVKVVVDYTGPTAPTVTTQAASAVESSTATGNGNITSTGGINASAWGVCYKTSAGCTTADSTAAGSGSGGTGAFTASLSGLSSGTTYYINAYATNTIGTGYGTETTFLTKPAAPTNVTATDGTYTDKVTISWTKSTGATNYRVWRDSTDLGLVGDVATYDDSGATAPSITPGTTVASDGTSTAQVDLSLSGASANNGTTHTYKVVASNATGNSADSTTNTGYRGVGSLSYQWQRSAADSDASYSDIGGATSAIYSDTGAPAPTITAGTTVASDGISQSQVNLSLNGTSANAGVGRYYKCILNATGATQQISTANRGYRSVGSLTYQWQRSAADSNANYSNLNGATSSSYNDTELPGDGSGRYYQCLLNANGASQQISANDRGFIAVISVSISANGTVSYGAIPFNTSKSTLELGTTPTARNIGNVNEDFTIKTSVATGGEGWLLGSNTNINVFTHEFSIDGGNNWTKFVSADTYAGPPAPVLNVAVNGTQSFDLRLTTPTLSDAIQKTITVTIMATQH